MCPRQDLYDIMTHHVSQKHKIVIQAGKVLCRWAIEYCQLNPDFKYIMVPAEGREGISIKLEDYQIIIFESLPIYQNQVSSTIGSWSQLNDSPNSSKWIQSLILEIYLNHVLIIRLWVDLYARKAIKT